MAKTDQKHFWQELTTSAAVEMLKAALLWGITFTLSLIGSKSLAENVALFAPFRWHLVILSFLTSAIFGVYCFRRLTKNVPFFNRVDVDFELQEKIALYEYNSDSNIVYKITYKIKALKNGVDRIYDRYKWSGIHPCKPETKVDGHSVHLLPEERFYQFFEIHFGRQYKRGEIINAEVYFSLQDLEGVSHPIISATIHEPVKILMLQVKMPEKFGVRSIRRTVAPDAGAKCNVDSEECVFENGFHSWRIKPKLLHFYELRWHRGQAKN